MRAPKEDVQNRANAKQKAAAEAPKPHEIPAPSKLLNPSPARVIRDLQTTISKAEGLLHDIDVCSLQFSDDDFEADKNQMSEDDPCKGSSISGSLSTKVGSSTSGRKSSKSSDGQLETISNSDHVQPSPRATSAMARMDRLMRPLQGTLISSKLQPGQYAPRRSSNHKHRLARSPSAAPPRAARHSLPARPSRKAPDSPAPSSPRSARRMVQQSPSAPTWTWPLPDKKEKAQGLAVESKATQPSVARPVVLQKTCGAPTEDRQIAWSQLLADLRRSLPPSPKAAPTALVSSIEKAKRNLSPARSTPQPSPQSQHRSVLTPRSQSPQPSPQSQHRSILTPRSQYRATPERHVNAHAALFDFIAEVTAASPPRVNDEASEPRNTTGMAEFARSWVSGELAAPMVEVLPSVAESVAQTHKLPMHSVGSLLVDTESFLVRQGAITVPKSPSSSTRMSLGGRGQRSPRVAKNPWANAQHMSVLPGPGRDVSSRATIGTPAHHSRAAKQASENRRS